MENKAHALAAGIFVAVLTALVLGLAAWLTRDTGARDLYEISTRETVTGLQEQAPVRFRGIDVGKVKRIGFDPKNVGSVLVRLEIDRETPLTRETFATLGYQGVTGLAFVQLSDEGRAAPRLVPNDRAPPRIPLRPGLLGRLEEQGEAILQRVSTLLDEPNQKRIAAALESISQAASSTNQLAARVDTTVRERLDPALTQATATLRGAQKTVDEVGAAAAQFGQAAQRINAPGGAVERLTEGGDALAQTAESFNAGTLPRLDRATDEATRTARTLHRAVNELTENPQMLIYGDGAPPPGPGEPGFRAPGGK
jgi:phospholipid/cholesterol/gamma-HCH transport system substrate-binding protein